MAIKSRSTLVIKQGILSAPSGSYNLVVCQKNGVLRTKVSVKKKRK